MPVAQAKALIDDHGDDPAALEQARALLQRVIDVDPRDSQSHVQMARYLIMAYVKDEEGDRDLLNHADGQLAWAFRLDARNADAYEILGSLRRSQKRYDEALEALRSAQAIGTSNPWLYYDFAKAYMGSGRWAEAAQSLRTLEREPGNSHWPPRVEPALEDAWLAIHLHDGDASAVARDYARMHAHNAGTDAASSNHALFLLGGKNDPDAAIAEAKRLLAKYPDDWHGRRVLALAQYLKWDQLRERNREAALRFRAAADSVSSDRAGLITTAVPWLAGSKALQHLVLALHAEVLSLDAMDAPGSTALLCAIDCNTRTRSIGCSVTAPTPMSRTRPASPRSSGP